jgi:flavorubredoxin
MSAALADAFRYDKLVLACNTYDGGINPFMNDFITRLTGHNFQKRTVALIENGSWAPVASKTMRAMLEKSKEITYVEQNITILSSVKPENKEQLKALAKELA